MEKGGSRGRGEIGEKEGEQWEKEGEEKEKVGVEVEGGQREECSVKIFNPKYIP